MRAQDDTDWNRLNRLVDHTGYEWSGRSDWDDVRNFGLLVAWLYRHEPDVTLASFVWDYMAGWIASVDTQQGEPPLPLSAVSDELLSPELVVWDSYDLDPRIRFDAPMTTLHVGYRRLRLRRMLMHLRSRLSW